MTNPTGYTALDLVGFTDKGTYASNVYYVKNDIVHYAGALYRCKIDDTINVTPGENANWTEFIGEPQSLVERIIAPLEDNPATVAYAVGRQIIYDDYLWEVIANIAVGDPLVDYDVDPTNANIKKSAPVETQLLDVKAKVGTLSSLATTVKTSIVAAINEVVGAIGALTSLTTTAKTSLVAAVNEVVGKVGDLTTLTTTAKTSAVAAINEVKSNTGTNASAITATRQMIAPIETDLSSASHAYAIGEQFIYNGLLYEATAAIAQGETIVIGGNALLADSVVEQINQLNSLVPSKYIGSARKSSYNVNLSNVSTHIIYGFSGAPANYNFAVMVFTNNEGTVSFIQIAKGDSLTISTSNGKLIITPTNTITLDFVDTCITGDFATIS